MTDKAVICQEYDAFIKIVDRICCKTLLYIFCNSHNTQIKFKYTEIYGLLTPMLPLLLFKFYSHFYYSLKTIVQCDTLFDLLGKQVFDLLI